MKDLLKKLYSLNQRVMPGSLNAQTLEILFNLGIKPSLNRKASSFFKKGVVVFSSDLELSWAWRYAKERVNISELAKRERNNTTVILEMLDTYRIPITWAIVGHLFLDQCEKMDGNKAHPDMIRPGYFENQYWKFKSGDWYDGDPCSNYLNSPEWYAPDLIENILKANVQHEIACHSFSHIDFSDQNCSSKLAYSEIHKCLELAKKFNIEMKSMVFPGNTYGNLLVLRELGFICYRKQLKYDIDVPIIDKFGLAVIPSSNCLTKFPFELSKDFYFKFLKKYVQVAIKNRLVCHFWFHPSMDNWYLNEIFPRILGYVHEQEIMGRLDVWTMKELAHVTAKLILKNNEKNSYLAHRDRRFQP